MSDTAPSEPRRLYQQIADRVRALIRDTEIAPNSRLPPERELAQMLNVSRPSLREAIIALEIEGTVEVRMGSGIYVSAKRTEQPTTTGLLGESPTEIMEARMVVEGAIAVLACCRKEPGLTGLLRARLDDMDAAIRVGAVPLDADREFHLAIARAAGNSVLERLVGDLFDDRRSVIVERLRGRSESQGTWLAALEEHTAILAALEAGNPLHSEAAMRYHLQRSGERWLGV